MLQKLTVATKRVRTLKAQTKKTSAGPLNAYKRPANPILRAIKALKGL
jgi:hypothetical protein